MLQKVHTSQKNVCNKNTQAYYPLTVIVALVDLLFLFLFFTNETSKHKFIIL